MTKVCLIDGSGYIFRAFYALPNMTAPDGTPVNAVYGFITMFMRLLNNIPCDYCAVLLDAKRQNFRNDFYAAYKTNREEVPELLVPQFELIHDTIKLMGLPFVLQEGYEADDLIATYAKAAQAKGFEVVIVSADKDLMQLIRPGITFYDGMKDKYYTPEDVKEKFGVYPDKVVDVQALSGDKIDNVPGVPGIGPKTAAELINQYGSLQAVLDNAANIKQNKRREAIEQNKEAALTSLRLVTLKDDVPVELDLENFHCQNPLSADLLKFAQRLGFKSIYPKLEKWINERQNCLSPHSEETPSLPEHKATEFKTVNSRTELEQLYLAIKKSTVLALQVLSDGQNILGFNLSPTANTAYFISWPKEQNSDDLFAFNPKPALENSTIRKFLQSVLNDKNILKIACDLKTQWHILNKLCQQELNLWPYEDIAVMSYDLDSSEHEHNLSALASYYGFPPLIEPKISANKPVDLSLPEFDTYKQNAADYILRLYPILQKRLHTEQKTYVYEMLDRRLIAVLQKMESAGIVVDDKCLADLDIKFNQQMKVLEQQIYDLAGEEFNLNSPKQIGEILFTKMGLKGKKTAHGSYNTSADVLELLAEEYEIAAKILEWRGFAKLQSTYTNPLLEARDNHNRIHTTFSQTVVNTGRLASSNPNLQNIPNRTDIGRQIRSCFKAKPGYKLVAADYSQMELRLMAEVADVKALQEAFANGSDIHAATAARVFNLPKDNVDREHRSRAKAINFGIIYGISQFGLAKQINTTREQAKQYIDSYFSIMPEVKEYMEKTKQFAHQNGYVLTPFGRKCALPGINNQNQRIASFAERAAINAPIQGGAADIVKLAMQNVDNSLKNSGYDAHLLLQVHDELIVEAKAEDAAKVAELMKNVMENITHGKVKMVVDIGIGDDWQSAH